jgi:2'-5' RNA ligase
LSEQEEAFPKVWESFCELDMLADGRHDTPAWRSHAGAFAVCIIRVPAAALAPELAELRRELATLPEIRLHPDHFLHISLQELGFVTDRPRQRDELSPAELEEFVSLAANPVGERSPFTVELGGANSFHDAPFLEVHDDEHSSRLHQRLYEISAAQRAPRFPYLPHVTIGHYTAATPAAAAIEVLAGWRNAKFGAFEVTEVEIVTLATNEPYPELQPYAVFPLAG